MQAPDARERLYLEVAREYAGALERLARAYERDADRRKDLLQEIHIGLWRSLAGFDGRCSLRTWIYRVAHNVATSHVIRPKARAPVLLSGADLETIPDTIDPEDRLNRQRALDKLYELVRGLRPVDRQVMLLYLEEVDAAAIGEITGLTAGNVATRIHRLKQLLAALSRQADGAQAGLDTLEEILDLARVVEPEKVPANTVTMNSRVMFEDVRSGEKGTVTIVYPADADASTRRISILSPVGAALIGEAQGAEVELPLPHGQTRRIRIVDVLYQPEAEGNFEL